MPTSPDYLEVLDQYVRHQWYINHYRADRGFPLLDSRRTVVVEHDLATDDERKKLPQYNELYLRFGYPGYAMIGFRVDGNPWVVPMLRATAQGHFSRQDAARLAELAPHFARMIRLSDRFALRQAQDQLDLLDRVACAAVLIDWKGTVIRINASAADLMGANLRVSRGMLTAADPPSNRALQTLVQQLRTLGSSRGGTPPGRVYIRRTNQAPMVIDALPVAGLAADAFRSARAVLTIADLDANPAPPEEALRVAFGLTAAEARLAAQLVGSGSLNAAADALGIAKETARNQLKAVFAKTGTHRQSQLVALLSKLARPGVDTAQK
jgi:DNA-binding CsgD family transcriptional regulator